MNGHSAIIAEVRLAWAWVGTSQPDARFPLSRIGRAGVGSAAGGAASAAGGTSGGPACPAGCPGHPGRPRSGCSGPGPQSDFLAQRRGQTSFEVHNFPQLTDHPPTHQYLSD